MPKLRTGLATALAVVACPCHVPLIIALFAGTTFGASLASHSGVLYVAMAALFLAGLVSVFARTGRTGDATSAPPASDHEERCERCTTVTTAQPRS